MADSNNSTMETLQAELNSLRSQLQNMADKAQDKEQEIVSRLTDRIGKELGRYRDVAKEQGAHLLDMGEAGLDEVAAQIRRNPLASLGIAFGAGWLLSCIWRSLR